MASRPDAAQAPTTIGRPAAASRLVRRRLRVRLAPSDGQRASRWPGLAGPGSHPRPPDSPRVPWRPAPRTPTRTRPAAPPSAAGATRQSAARRPPASSDSPGHARHEPEPDPHGEASGQQAGDRARECPSSGAASQDTDPASADAPVTKSMARADEAGRGRERPNWPAAAPQAANREAAAEQGPEWQGHYDTTQLDTRSEAQGGATPKDLAGEQARARDEETQPSQEPRRHTSVLRLWARAP